MQPATRRNYLLYGRKLAAFYRRSPKELGEAEIRRFLMHLIQVDRVSYATYRQVLAAVRFLIDDGLVSVQVGEEERPARA